MLKIDRTKKTFSILPKRSLREAGLLERDDLQKMIRQSPGDFCAEIGESIFFVAEEVAPTDFVADRIDLLGLDQDGAAVIVELKRDSHKLHLLQALAYAGMVAKWEPSRFTSELIKYRNQSKLAEQSAEDLEKFLGDPESINQTQRIVLLAEDFDYEVLVTAEWLTEKYLLDIRCYRLTLSSDSNSEYVSCSCVYPPPEIRRHSVRRGRVGDIKPSKWSNWDEVYHTIKNKDVVEFFKFAISKEENSYLRKRRLSFFVSGHRRYNVLAKRNHAYVWQIGRFNDDVSFWTDLLGVDARVEPVKENAAIRFYLTNADQFQKFRTALDEKLKDVEFVSTADSQEDEADEEAS